MFANSSGLLCRQILFWVGVLKLKQCFGKLDNCSMWACFYCTRHINCYCFQKERANYHFSFIFIKRIRIILLPQSYMQNNLKMKLFLNTSLKRCGPICYLFCLYCLPHSAINLIMFWVVCSIFYFAQKPFSFLNSHFRWSLSYKLYQG